LNEGKISLLSPIQILSSPGSAPANQVPPLNPGEILEGTILDQKEPDRFFIRIKGQDLWVQSQVPLPAGGKIPLKVETVSPQVLLKLLPARGEGEPAALGQFKRILGEGDSLGNLAEKITALGKTSLEPFSPEVQKAFGDLKAALAQYAPPFLTDPQTLREKVSQSGLFWERRLQELFQKRGETDSFQVSRQDLKGLLLKLRSLLPDASSLEGGNVMALPKAEESLQALETYLQKIEAYQLLNQRYGEASEKWLLLLPLWFGQELQFLELSMSFSREEGAFAAEEQTSLLFLLNLPETGNIKIEVVIRRKDLFCRIHLAAPDFHGEIQRNLPELENRLRTLGFHPSVSISEGSWEGEQEAIVCRLDESGENLVSLLI
jgi:hypothetical protein